MNALTKTAYPLSRIGARRFLALGRPTYTTTLEIELTGDWRCGASLHCEIEFYEECPAVPGYGDEPDEPAQYAVTSIRPYEYRVTATGFMGTQRHYFDVPEPMQDLLLDCVDENKLGDAVEAFED